GLALVSTAVRNTGHSKATISSSYSDCDGENEELATRYGRTRSAWQCVKAVRRRAWLGFVPFLVLGHRARDLTPINIDYELCLVGKFLGERAINFAAMERTLLSLWRPLRGVNIKSMDGNGLCLIQFYHVVDLKKMISSSPWSFNNCFLLVHKFTQGENLKDVNFYYADSRIQ
ncbi:hypothetical protein Gohar_025394, partial [Gossypium harknessii]|nr:hypothetical protein [Gossypium harknessii]